MRYGAIARISGAAMLAGACLAAAPAAAMAGPSCATGAVAEAMQVRALNSRLMVAALSCKAEGDYNAFVQQFDDVLNRSGQRLVDWFAPRGGQRALTGYVTGLANKASFDSLGDRYTFCATARDIFEDARGLDDAGLIALSRSRPRTEAETPDVCL